jgi:rubrerythrin
MQGNGRQEVIMELFDIAIRMEAEGAAFYRDLAKKASSEGFTNIFTMLAEDEDRHRATFEAMKANTSVPASTSDASVRASQIFKQFSKDDFLHEESQLALYEEALEIELKAIEFYSEQHEKVSDVKQKRALAKIIEEERRHYDLLDDIIVMVERPESWIEHAEFGVREDY